MVPRLEGFWSFWLLSVVVLSLTGPKTLLATVASWDTTFSTPLSGASTGELELELERDVDALRLTLAAAAHSLRLSASFFSLGMPGEEQEVRGVSWLSALWQSVVTVDVLESVVLVVVVQLGEFVVTVVLGLSRVWSSAMGSEGAVFPLRLFESCGGVGLRKVSLPTEMNALPGVEKGRGPSVGFVAPLGPRTFLSCLALSSVDEAVFGSFTTGEEVL